MASVVSLAEVVLLPMEGTTIAAKTPSKTTTIRISTRVKALARLISAPFMLLFLLVWTKEKG
jgi:hypothetical protein